MPPAPPAFTPVEEYHRKPRNTQWGLGERPRHDVRRFPLRRRRRKIICSDEAYGPLDHTIIDRPIQEQVERMPDATGNPSGSLKVGAATADITPQAGVQLAGDVGSRRGVRMVVDPLYARALVVESNGRTLCVVALDLTIVCKPNAGRIRRAVSERFGIDYDAVMVHATQTHTGPCLGNIMLSDEFPLPDGLEWLRGGDTDYDGYAEDATIDVVGRALDHLTPVSIGAGSGIEGRLAFNRRAVGRDGKVFMPGPSWPGPLGHTDILYMEGPIDPELGVVAFRADDASFPALAVNYTCHPVHVFPRPVASADWPGALAADLGASTYAGDGGACVPLVLNGACGNINPWPPFDPDYVEDHVAMGCTLANTVRKVMETLDYDDDATVDWRTRHLEIPYRRIDPDILAAAREKIEKNPDPVWNADHDRVDSTWFRAAGLVDLAREQDRNGCFDYELQVFRVGDVAFVGMPGEPFVEGGLKIKLESAAPLTYIVHCVNQYVGYIPTSDALPGGHEVETSTWSKLVPEALDTIVDASVDMIAEMFE
jgi:neutral ceramidase